MKNIIYLLVIVLFASCQDVVNVDLDTANPKLVIDANILWQKGTSGNEQTIKLTTTTNYYSNVVPTVSGAIVYVASSDNTIFNFIEVPNTGEYVCNNFIPVINENYTLTVEYNGIMYKATEKLLATPTIETVEQTTLPGLGGDLTQVKFFFQDNGSEDNYYLGKIKKSTNAIPELGVFDDEFFQGNQMFGLYVDDKIEVGDQLNFKLQGVSLRYYNYMNKLINIAGSSGGNPFATPPATLRGNIIDQNDADNYPLGYFHLSEIDSRDYTIQ